MAREREYKAKVSASSINYIIPKDTTRQQFTALYKLWNDKLAKSGFNDIEHFVLDANSIQNTYFRPSNSGFGDSHSFGTRIDAATADYYNMCQNFLTNANWRKLFRKHFKAAPYFRAGVFRFIFACHVEGFSYREIVELLKYNYDFIPVYRRDKIPERRGVISADRSLFWVHWQMLHILKGMKRWYSQQNTAVEVTKLDES